MKRLQSIPFLFVILMFLTNSLQAQFKWPDGKEAAVVFTYDDGLDCHLDVAVPQLDMFGFKGTFYCTGNSPSLYKRSDEWRAIAAAGHELGNHTLFHPCDGEQFDWVKPEYDLNSYSLDRILTELRTAGTLLKAIDGKTERTFAYTCSNYLAGDEDFSDDLEDLFVAARCGFEMPSTMEGYNVYKTPAWGVSDPSAEELISYVEKARKNGTIAIFMFHSVGGGYLNVGAEQHRVLLEYVKKNEKDLYTGTFLEVMKYIKANR